MNGVRIHVRNAVRGVRAAFAYLSAKKYTTLAGTMAFFLVMSVVPFLFWLTLLFGKLHIDYAPIFDLEIFADFREIFLYFRDAAANATAGASVVLLATTLYSSSNLFFHMRRSGEIIYEVARKKAAFIVRLSALALIFIVLLLLLAGISLFLVGVALLPRILPSFAAQVAVYLLFGCVVFALLLLLNLYICPYRVRVGDVVWGSLLTLLLGGAASFGFSIYVRFSSIGKLYGAAVFLILFLLWLYILMTCFVIGVIFNCYLLEKDKKQKIVHKKF
ncbi:MAG TPA: YihY/virulence factor BrkB family protein [Candidatus Borkfalkia faecigallinarum]|uniref:YihY/virulence factor BrkB family protein n=1 Tax=Candidatus Borkfalkia faecigallinarum TaxID=2838509 RepID=A0A9D1VUW0_9FIRM|nr:YihY/virulence factor BrkB family protein [Candidatus Borkfalkia faecigallinarum]